MDDDDDEAVPGPATKANRHRVAVLVASVVAIIVVAGGLALVRFATTTHGCTLVACTSGVRIDVTSIPEDVLTAATSGTVCANDRCENLTIGPGTTISSSGLLYGASVTIAERTVRSASIRLTDAQGNEILELELSAPQEATEFQPNGPDCEPTCWGLELIAKNGSLERSDQFFGSPTGSR